MIKSKVTSVFEALRLRFTNILLGRRGSNRWLVPVIVGAGLSLCGGCTTTKDTNGGSTHALRLPLPGAYEYDITSSPAGADVYINGELRGKTPLTWKRMVLMQSVETTVIEAKLPQGASGIVKGPNYGQKPKLVENAAIISWGLNINVHFDLTGKPAAPGVLTGGAPSATQTEAAEAGRYLMIETDSVVTSAPRESPATVSFKAAAGGAIAIMRKPDQEGAVLYIGGYGLWVDGSVHTYIGNVEWNNHDCLRQPSGSVNLKGYTFASNPDHPLRFMVRTIEGSKGFKYVYVSGSGKVIKADRTSEVFP